MSLSTEISVGEFLDKVTILEIKNERIKDAAKLENVNKELTTLRDIWSQSSYSQLNLTEEVAQLKEINEKLWEIEDDIRDKERDGEFDERFIELARAVYFTNDERANVKKKINMKAGSELVEEKSYADYTQKS